MELSNGRLVRNDRRTDKSNWKCHNNKLRIIKSTGIEVYHIKKIRRTFILSPASLGRDSVVQQFTLLIQINAQS